VPSPTVPSSRKPPSLSAAIAGSGVLASRSQLVARARFEPELSCPAQHLGNADRRRAKTMADLLGICADAVKAQQHHQGS
jgi:hypothetical protein